MSFSKKVTGCIGAVVGLAVLASCGDDGATDRPIVVVTYSALESVVADIVGDVADVEVVIPNGVDPHDFAPSAKDVERMTSAAAVIANGLDLEAGLGDAIERAEKSGALVVFLSDHVTLRDGAEADHDGADVHEGDAHGDEKGAADPHVWLDPVTLAQAIPVIADEIGEALGVDLDAAAADVVADLNRLDREIADRIGAVESCVVITGHDSLGYFGARYECEVLGSIVPSFSTAAEATARDLAELKKLATDEGVRAIFTELGTPDDVARRLAEEVGVDVVEIATHVVPDGGGYEEMMLMLTDAIVGGLS